jgi:hypothetical protein
MGPRAAVDQAADRREYSADLTTIKQVASELGRELRFAWCWSLLAGDRVSWS